MAPFKPITREEVAANLSVSLSTLDTMIAGGIIPRPCSIRGSRRKYWHPDIYYAWLDRQLRQETPAEATPAAPASPKPRKTQGRRPPPPMGIADRARARNAARIAGLSSESESD